MNFSVLNTNDKNKNVCLNKLSRCLQNAQYFITIKVEIGL